MAKETTKSKKDWINCNDNNNTQLSQDTSIPSTPLNAKTTNILKTKASTKNKDKSSSQDNEIYYSPISSNVIPQNNKILQNESSESSEDEEYEIPSKEPYEDKYIKLTTIDALDFLQATDDDDIIYSDSVLSVIHKAANLTFVLCLISSMFSAFFSKLESNSGFSWTKFYIFCVLFWVYCLYRLNLSSSSLKDTISAAKGISIGIAVIQSIYQVSIWITNNREGDLVNRSPLLYAGSVISVPFLALFEEVLNAYQKENALKQALLEEERANSQKSIYNAIDHFGERKGLYLRTISDQLRQTTNMAMDTLKQLSPPHFLSKPHEQLSACSISFPIASISAIHSTLKDINYISTHLGTLSLLLFSEQSNQESRVKREFDIGEVIQHVGDVLAGDACKAKVELVIYHVEYGLNHLNVIGDEAALRHSLLDLLKCIIGGASPGDCVELGLQIRPSNESEFNDSLSEKEQDKVTCVIEVIHNAENAGSEKSNISPNVNLTHKILSFLGASLKVGEGLEITIELEAGSPLAPSNLPKIDEENRRRYPHSRITGEPSIDELIKTSQNMRGQRVALHATSKSYFAKHITSCLTTWGTDISHVPIGDDDEFETKSKTGDASDVMRSSEEHKSHDEQSLNANLPPTFIIIDDDIETLRQQLIQLKRVPFPLSGMTVRSKRQAPTPTLSSQTTAVIHFTSLTNYKPVKDVVQCVTSEAGSFSLPQILVIPKPAGPRRFLTALHTTINRIVVDPVYMPIATSPMSPGQQIINGGYSSGIESDTINVGDPKFTEPPGNYFPLMHRPGTPLASNNNPLSPKNGPGGGLLVVPKNNLTRNPDGQGMIKKVGSNSPGRNVPFQNTGPLSPTVGKGTGTPINGNSTVASPNSIPTQQSSSPPPPQNPSPTQQPRFVNNKKSKTKKKTNADTVIPPVNVLIVEDNPINQAILSTFMKRKKIKYECASNGQEAVDKWQKGGFHLVLMDIQLPVMDGIEATKRIRSLEKSQKIGVLPSTPSSASTSESSSTSSTPISTPMKQTPPSTPDLGLIPVIILALTASSLPSDRQNALAAGCNDFLTKPVSLEWLEKKIQEWGCMQALVDFDGWKRWKRDGEEAKEKRAESTTDVVSPGGKKSNTSNSENPKQNQTSQIEDNNSIIESSSNGNKTTMNKSPIKITTSRPKLPTKTLSPPINNNNSNEVKEDKFIQPMQRSSSATSTPTRTPSGGIKISPVGVMSEKKPPPIVIKPSTPQLIKELATEPTESIITNNISSKICSENNTKNNLISNNALTITTNTSIPSTTNTTNESSSQPSTPLSTSASQKIVRKRGNTFSSATGVNMNISDQNGNGHI